MERVRIDPIDPNDPNDPNAPGLDRKRRSTSLPWNFCPVYDDRRTEQKPKEPPRPSFSSPEVFLNVNEIKLARQWIHASKFRAYAHHACARGYSIVHGTSLLFIVIMASMSSCYNVYTSIRKSQGGIFLDEKDAKWSVGIAVLNGFIVVITTIHHYCKVSSIMYEHAHASREYSNLARDVQVELVLTRSMRTGMYSSPAEFMRDIKRRLEDIADQEPSIPRFVSRRINKRIRKNLHAMRASVYAFPDAYEMSNVADSEISSEDFPIQELSGHGARPARALEKTWSKGMHTSRSIDAMNFHRQMRSIVPPVGPNLTFS